MFNQQQTRRPPGAPMQPPPVSQNDIQAKEKLASYVYEYLVHSGASKTAESFKNEVLANTTNAKNATPCETGPGFLQNWWLVFWDLYCAAPERRDGPEGSATLEAKAFHDYGFVPNSFGPPGMMNGMHPQFGGNPSAMGMPPGPDGMMPGHPGAAGFPPGRFPPGRGPPGGPPGGMPPGAPPGAFPMQFDPRMGQRLPPAAMRMPTSFPGMRPGPGAPGAPGGPPGAPQMRPYGAPFMDSPGAAFPPQQMMPNGGMMAGQAPMSMNSPGPNGPMGGGEHDPRFMMMPSSSQAMPFPMDTSSTPGGGAVGTPGSAPPPMGEGGSQLAGMLNGEEMKQSPASTPRGVANGTPGGGGPGSAAPGSVQSGGGGGGGAAAPPAEGGEDASEISKIKQSIMDDVKLFGGEEMKQDFF